MARSPASEVVACDGVGGPRWCRRPDDLWSRATARSPETTHAQAGVASDQSSLPTPAASFLARAGWRPAIKALFSGILASKSENGKLAAWVL